MTDQPTNPQPGNNPSNDTAIDKTADNAINQGIDAAANRIPGGQKFDQTAKNKADQAANPAINKEAGSLENDAKGLIDKNK